MKKILAWFCMLSVLLCSFPTVCFADSRIELSAETAILIDLDDGTVLYEKNADRKMGPASTTKIMTALTVIRYTSPLDTVTVTADAVGTEGSSVYLCLGEQLTVEQLLFALLLSSANDAAVALAIHVSGSIDKFASAMNEYASELGLKNTSFTNPHGLSCDGHYTTARELAIITQAAMKEPILCRIFATYRATIPFDGEPDKRLLINHNKLLRTYDGAIGVKTGYTKATGRTLVSAAKRDGMTLIAVTMNAPDDWRDHTALLDYGFGSYERITFYGAGEFKYAIPVSSGNAESLTLINSTPLCATVKKRETSHSVTITSTQRFAIAPVRAGDVFGEAKLSTGNLTVHSQLVAESDVLYKNSSPSFWSRILERLKKEIKKWQL